MLFLLITVATILVYIYSYSVRNFQYWKKKAVKYTKPVPLFGNSIMQMLQRISIAELITESYKNYPNEKIVGFFVGNNQALILRDPEVIKNVVSTDFAYFYPRGISPHKEVFDPLMKNLFTVDGDIWKLLRQRMTPAFTSAKLKAMFPLIVDRAEKLKIIAAQVSETNKEIDVRDLMARYTTDFIGACGFGVDADALNDENSTFRKLGRRIFTTTVRDSLVFMFKMISPETFKRVNFFAPEIQTNTVRLVRSIMEQRNNKVSGKNDFIDLLLELKEKGKLVGESVEKRKPDGTPEMVEIEIDELLMAAQAFIFFAAGFETSSSSTSHTLHQLAFHPVIQEKCQKEIDEVLSKHDGALCYDAVKNMKYLEMVFKESLRMLPPLGFISRRCAKRYYIPGTDVTIDEDVSILVPVHALHNDEKYFEKPEMFIPERFHPDNVDKIKKYTYMPFGEGPRACERLGIMQSMAGLAALLSDFTVRPSENSVRKLKIDPTSTVVQTVKGGIPLELVSRKKDLQIGN